MAQALSNQALPKWLLLQAGAMLLALFVTRVLLLLNSKGSTDHDQTTNSAQGQHRLQNSMFYVAGGSLQHARGLLSIISSGSSLTGSSSSCTGSSGAPLSQDPGRSISTTRGIYMGR